MNFIHLPNLPQMPVKAVVVDGRIGETIKKGFAELDIHIIRTGKLPGVYEAVSFHPDIMLHHVGDNVFVHAPGTDRNLLKELSLFGFKLIEGSAVLSSAYPGNIAYNVARIGNVAFHNLKHTDPVLKKELNKAGVELVHVNQGYAKCSVSVVDEKSIITSDEGIAKAVEKKGIEVLRIPPDEGILLPGLNNGFIGGSSGLLAKNRWALAGNAGFLKSFSEIKSFLNKKNIEVISLSHVQVMDIGSIIPVLTE